MTSDPSHRSLLDLYGATDWYVAQLKPNGLALAQRNLGRQAFRAVSPYRVATQRRSGRLAETREPIFPGYLLVQFDPGATAWRAINSTRGVVRLLVDDPRRPTALPEAFCEGLLARCSPDAELGPEETLKPGDVVRVTTGPFADAVSAIDALGRDGRVRLLLEMLGRAARMEVPSDAVERVNSAS